MSKHPIDFSRSSRRAFLQRAGELSLAGVAAPWALKLPTLAEASAQTAGETANDYKALVCVFLYGANDHGNTVVPFDASSHAAYSTICGTTSTPCDALTATAPSPSVALPNGRQMAMAPEFAPLKSRFHSGRLGVLLNVGPLIRPTTLAQYNARNVPLPPKLFSHNNQQSVWQSSLPEGSTSGWGGRIGDLLMAGNEKATFSCINVSGNAVFMSGRQAVQYQVSSSGSVALRGIQSQTGCRFLFKPANLTFHAAAAVLTSDCRPSSADVREGTARFLRRKRGLAFC